MEQAFELKFGSAQTLEKGHEVHPVEAPEYREEREQAQKVEIATSERAVEQARNTLASVAVRDALKAPSILTAESVQSHFEAVKAAHGIASISTILVPEKTIDQLKAALAMYIPNTPEYVAGKLYQAEELICESYLEPHKLAQAEKILIKLESKLN